MSDTLNVFDYPIKESLEAYVQKVGHNAVQLTPIIAASIEQAKSTLPVAFQNREPRIIRQRLESIAKTYVNAVLSQTKKWEECRECIKVFYSVFLVGAGLSYGSDMPLSNILDHLLKFCGVPDWATLRDNPDKCLLFKEKFKEVCDTKSPSASHILLISNFPDYIWEIICLNWDDLFEKAAKQLGKATNKCNMDVPVMTDRHMWKFHGDVETITRENTPGEGGWIFPDEQGYVFDSFQNYVIRTGLQNRPFTFVIVGYSEREANIYDQIVAMLEHVPTRPTFRIGVDLRNLHETNHIVGTAEFVLHKILPVAN